MISIFINDEEIFCNDDSLIRYSEAFLGFYSIHEKEEVFKIDIPDLVIDSELKQQISDILNGNDFELTDDNENFLYVFSKYMRIPQIDIKIDVKKLGMLEELLLHKNFELVEKLNFNENAIFHFVHKYCTSNILSTDDYVKYIAEKHPRYLERLVNKLNHRIKSLNLNNIKFEIHLINSDASVDMNQNTINNSFPKATVSNNIEEHIEPIVSILFHDNILELQKMASSPTFDFNGALKHIDIYLLIFGIYLRCRYIACAAFFGSIKCFKYLLMNGSRLELSIESFAVSGGNLEIIHICQQHGYNHFSGTMFSCIKYHRYDIFEWIIQNFGGLQNAEKFIYSGECAKYCCPKIFETLLDYDDFPSLNYAIEDVLYQSSKHNNNDFVKIALLAGKCYTFDENEHPRINKKSNKNGVFSLLFEQHYILLVKMKILKWLNFYSKTKKLISI
ncbi:hypothetical protein TRFO_22955 [Tritrichomonas foetus]|uniref:DUF3447 domain-containing protein n=1 Tax=Tritrichomonas foetus TaxID=1144522 RepID=A0A1J4KGS4_9EUKA|nr:hypothetical protein TRFO_22955 [Tritrichomonas foetus]|eukprot:OHT08525.1 hypothetical protein TRFO_22955 [Tritrichomonas foetus]